MKSAEEWYGEHVLRLELFRGDDRTPEQFIRAIQADAIRAAAEKCAPDRKDRDFVPGSFWERLEAEQRARILFLLPEASK